MSAGVLCTWTGGDNSERSDTPAPASIAVFLDGAAAPEGTPITEGVP